FAGAARAMPMTFLTLGLGGLSLMGLPPSGGFATKVAHVARLRRVRPVGVGARAHDRRPARGGLCLPHSRPGVVEQSGPAQGAAAPRGRGGRPDPRRHCGSARLRAGVVLPPSRYRPAGAHGGGPAMTVFGPILLGSSLAVPAAFL